MKRLHVGTMGWSYDFWRGNFYPEDSKNLLTEYAKNFDTVEIDNTFYRIPSQDTVKKWREETPDEFIFTAKFPRKITHIKMLQDCQEEVTVFVEHMSLMRDKRGPMLIQLPPGFKPEMAGILKDFLAGLPEGRFAVEVRNKKWLEEKFYDMLKDYKVALSLIDHPWMPPMNTITADFTYIRWVGDRKKVNGRLGKVEKDRSEDIKDWAGRIKGFMDDSIEVFGYFSKSYSGYPPGDVRMLLDHVKNTDS
ncbi:MAG: hypothetical protein C3F06_01385 [Candidatus Methanoperedenaceae archaeon]|nr:MAG: hypothetical protein C3F06_01385 [Candidatus Methanoperedenaceae archaeon]